MRLIAKHYCRLDDATLATLEKICRKLDPGNRRQMTERNRKRLGQFDDPRNVGAPAHIPRAGGQARRWPRRTRCGPPRRWSEPWRSPC